MSVLIMRMHKSGAIALALSLLACAAVFVVLNHEDTPTADEHILASEWIEAEAEAGSSSVANEKNVIKSIVNLKAYCMAAKQVLDGMDEFKGKLKSGAMEFVAAFGQATGKEVITEFATTIGDLEAEHPSTPGLSGYLLNNLNENILKGHSAVQIGLSGDEANLYFLDPSAFGLRVRPKYFTKLGVRVSAYNNFQAKIHSGDAGKAIKAMSKSRLSHIYEGMFDKLTATYQAKQQTDENLQEAGGKVAIQAGYDHGEEKGLKHGEAMQPLPQAGGAGAASVRAKSTFKMPSVAQVRKEAMTQAKKFMQAMAKKYSAMNVDQIVQSIQDILEGTTVRVTTGRRMFAQSNQSPQIKIVGTKDTIIGLLDYLPLNGLTGIQHFKSKGGKSIGVIKYVVLKGDTSVDNPWMGVKVEAQVGHGNPWVRLTPNGKTSFVDGWWLDSKKKSKKGPYYRLAHNNQWLLLPTSQDMSYVKKWANKSPTCATLKCLSEAKRGEMELACDKHIKCQGFTFTAGASKTQKGEGCLKYRCNTADQDTDTDTDATFQEKKHDYWSKQAFEFRVSQPDACSLQCGLSAVTMKGQRYCAQITDDKKVVYEKCALWHPAIMVPKIPTRRCQATKPCVAFRQVQPASCRTSCGVSSYYSSGAVECRTTIGNYKKPSLYACQTQVKPRLYTPSTPTRRCPSTAMCVQWLQRFKYGCSGSCGQSAHMITSTNFCANMAGTPVAASNCRSTPQPAKKSRHCSATTACPLPSGSCCWMVAWGSSATSCARCAGGHHFEWAWTCGGSRGCD